ncbi:MAG: hypothetical protein CL819_15365, partial [Croceicoccus sp.]|nr:hypothetical protein [Croceicoccus sp.]
MQASVMRHALAIALALPLCGCLAGKLRTPVEDHYAQTRAITDTCKSGGYGVECPADLVEVLEAVIDGTLDTVELEWSEQPAVCVVMASGGYPGK